MIEVSHLVKSYRDLKAVNDVSFKVEKGEILGFLGPNGAGKTTTMRMITGVIPPSSGSVKVAGYDVFEQPMEVKRRIGYLPETPPVYTDMTVRAGWVPATPALLNSAWTGPSIAVTARSSAAGSARSVSR